jgi:acyl carrier protein
MPNEVVDRDQGIGIIRGVIAECLARDAAEVRPESRIVTDLGADSLDFIDLIFTLEKRFGVRIRENDLSMMTRPDVSNPPGPVAEYLTSEAVSRLLPWLPELAGFSDLTRVRPVQVLPLVTVESLWRLVELKRKSAST